MRVLCEKCPLSLVAVVVITVPLGHVARGTEGPAGSVEEPRAPSIAPWQDPNELRWDLADGFEFGWESVKLSASIANRPEEQGGQVDTFERTLTILGRTEILDVNDMVGIGVSHPEILSVLDGDGNDVRLATGPAGPRRRYQPLNYYPDVWDPSREIVLRRARPRELCLLLDLAADQPVPSSLSLLEWCIYALYAKDIIQVDVPFQASEEWVEAAPDLEILVSRARFECCNWEYITYVKSQSGSVRGLADSLSSEEEIADYVILEIELHTPSGDSLPISAQEITGDPYGARTWGQVTRPGYSAVETIRHIIAVRPTEARIPFAWTDIPVPKP